MAPACATSTTKKRQEILPLFAFYQNHSAGTRLRHFHNPCARTASRLSLGAAILWRPTKTERVCNRFYALLRLLVCADPGHAPKYAKKRRYKTAAFRFLSEPLRGHKAKAFYNLCARNCVQAQPGSAGTGLRHFYNLCARTASGLSPGLGLVDFAALHNEAAASHGSDVLHGITVKGNHISKLTGLDGTDVVPLAHELAGGLGGSGDRLS